MDPRWSHIGERPRKRLRHWSPAIEMGAIREKDHIFKSRRNGDRLMITREGPTKYSHLGIQLDDNAIWCRFDLPLLL